MAKLSMIRQVYNYPNLMTDPREMVGLACVLKLVFSGALEKYDH